MGTQFAKIFYVRDDAYRSQSGPTWKARMPQQDADAADPELTRLGLERQAVIVAVFRALAADPEGTMKLLRPHLPERKHPGRPRKANQEGP